jgi:CBS domain containing-hemolysin-like protein
LALLIVSYLHVVLGEMVPKNISFSVPDKAVLFLAPPLVFVSRVISPVIRSSERHRQRHLADDRC